MKYETNNVTKLFLKLLPVQIFLSLTSGITSVVNGLIVGNYFEPNAMRTIGLIAPMSALLAGLASIVSGGSVILCGRHMGKGEIKKINEVFVNAMLTIISVGIVLTIGIFLFSNQLAISFGARGELLEGCGQYIRSLSIGIVPLLMLPTFMIFLQINNKSGISLLATVIVGIFNLVFGLANVFLFHGGIRGIGLASSFSNYCTAIFVILYLLKQKDMVDFKLNLFQPSVIKNILLFGSPSSLASILYALRNVFINRFAFEVGGEVAVSALAILASSSIFFDSFNIGVGNCISILGSVFIGEKNVDSLKKLMKTAIFYGWLFAAIKLMVAIGFGDKIAMVFGAKDMIIPTTKELLIFYCISAPFNIITLLFIGILQSQGKVKFCNIVYLINCILTPLFCCAILSKVFGIRAIWALYTIAECITLIIITTTAIVKNKGMVHKVEELFMLGDELNPDQTITLTVNKVEDVVSISKKIQDFCEAHEIDHQRSMYAALCMEEMAGNVIEHGFTKDNKEHQLDLYAGIEKGVVTLRLRDDCVPFDPKSKLKIVDTEDPVKNIGIKLVSKLAKEMNYQTTFGMNVLTIVL